MVRENSSDTYHYVYSDQLGSILTLTDASGSVEVEQNFDAWGRHRNPTDWSYNAVPARPDWLYRGYTGHEMLDPFVLINMNGRIYDPVLGRVLSPDNYVQDPLGTQGFNRYSYALNNPLKYTDPDGNFAFVPILAAAIQAAFFAGATYTIHAAITGQSLSGMGRSMLTAALTAGLSAGLSSLLNIANVTDVAGELAVGLLPKATPVFVKTLLAHGLSSGLTGSLGAGINGANLIQGFTRSAIQGLAFSALGQGMKGLKALGASTEDRLDVVDLPEVRVKATRELTPKIFSVLTDRQRWADHFAYPLQIADAAQWMVGLQASIMFNAISFGLGAGTVRSVAAEGIDKIKYIGRLDDLSGIPRAQTFLDDLPYLANPKANYYQNMSVIRKAIREGYVIKDASFFRPNSQLAPTNLNPFKTIRQTVLGQERNLLNNLGIWP